MALLCGGAMASWRLLCHHDRAGAMWLRLVRLGCTARRPAIMVRAWGACPRPPRPVAFVVSRPC